MRLIEQLRWWASECDRTNFGCQARKLLLEAAEAIEKLSAASLRPKGEWERRMVQDPRIHTDMAWCSNCGYHMIFNREFDNFCSNCGADMRQTEGENMRGETL